MNPPASRPPRHARSSNCGSRRCPAASACASPCAAARKGLRALPTAALCALLAALASAASAADVLVEAEAFGSKGCWVVDTQFADTMGSPYLLAHGLGVPVAEAVTTVALPSPGTWRVWVRTRDWTPDFAGEKPGRFEVRIDGAALPTVFGIAPSTWGWMDGGTVTPAGATVELRLRDLTGFDGRCDAILFTDALTAGPPPNEAEALRAWRAERRGEAEEPEATADFDFVVVGGGIVGTCAAIAAAERGLSVALIQDRPILGGNASGEIRVRTEGEKRHRIVEAVANNFSNTDPGAHAEDTKRLNEVAKYPGIALHTGWRAYGVVTNAARHLAAVDARRVDTGARKRFRAPLFADCTGDGWLGYWAGATYRMGREAKAEFGETLAPSAPDGMTMGNTLMWRSKGMGVAVAFPEVPWAMSVAGSTAETGGNWNWEAGFGQDTITDAEAIRDHLLRAIYGTFSNAKKLPVNATRGLEWVPYVAGKRESRRLLGDYLLTQDDIERGRYFEDAVGTATWGIDLHFPTAVSYRSGYSSKSVSRWYFPFRILYSHDIPNLFMAGRNVSVSHVALGSPRVMNTTGQMGVAVGYAAALCKAYDCTPRDLYRSPAHTVELQLLIGGIWPERVYVPPDAVIVDNAAVPAADIAGVWTASTYETGKYYGSNYLHDGNTGKGPDKWIRFRPDLPATGRYELRQIWNSSPSRATNVTVEVTHAEGVSLVSVDMQQGGGVWNPLGSWSFETGATSSARILTVGTSGHIIADAFCWVFLDGPPPDEDDWDGNGLSDDWERYHFLNAGGVDPDADPDGDGFCNFGEYLAGTDPLDRASVFSIRDLLHGEAEGQPAPGELQLRWPSLEGRVYDVRRAATPDGPFDEVVASGLAATPPVNRFSFDPEGPVGFFRIVVRFPE